MKTNNIIYKLLRVILFSVFFLTSCNDNEDGSITFNTLDKSTIEDAPLDTQIEYANKHLLDIGKVIMKMNHNEDFKSILYNNIKKKSNSEDIVSSILIKDLILDIKAKGSSTFFINEDDKMSLEKSLEAFYDLDGQDWHPEIIITNFEEKYQKFSSLAEKKSSSKSKPLIVPVVFEDNDENTEDAYDAYQEDDNGKLQATGFKVTQSDAKTKDILFLKISGSYNSGDTESGKGVVKSKGSSYSRDLYLDRMTVKHHKEPVGKSKVVVAGFASKINSDWTGFDHVPSYVRPMETQELMFKYKRRWIRRKKSRPINRVYKEYGPNLYKGYYDVISFESDGWPAPERVSLQFITVNRPFWGDVRLESKLYYRSWQGQYGREQIKPKLTGGWTFQTRSIKYNFKFK